MRIWLKSCFECGKDVLWEKFGTLFEFTQKKATQIMMSYKKYREPYFSVATILQLITGVSKHFNNNSHRCRQNLFNYMAFSTNTWLYTFHSLSFQYIKALRFNLYFYFIVYRRTFARREFNVKIWYRDFVSALDLKILLLSVYHIEYNLIRCANAF